MASTVGHIHSFPCHLPLDTSWQPRGAVKSGTFLLMVPSILDKMMEASHLTVSENSPRKYRVLCSERRGSERGCRSVLGFP